MSYYSLVENQHGTLHYETNKSITNGQSVIIKVVSNLSPAWPAGAWVRVW